MKTTTKLYAGAIAAATNTTGKTGLRVRVDLSPAVKAKAHALARARGLTLSALVSQTITAAALANR